MHGYKIAAAAGLIHGGFSLYWGLGGTRLLDTVGSVADSFDGMLWMILVVGVAKLALAGAPLVWDLTWAYRLAAALLVVWGAVSMAGAGIGLLLGPDNLTSTLGHLLLWDPLFVFWGVALWWGTRKTLPEQGF